MSSAYARQSSRTMHARQIALARASRASRAVRDSGDDGGKNTFWIGPRQAASRCHDASRNASVTSSPPPSIPRGECRVRERIPAPSNRSRSFSATALLFPVLLAVVLGAARLRLDLEHEALDLH